MSDPWTDIRKIANNPEPIFDTVTIRYPILQRLIVDADALLAVARAAENLQTYIYEPARSEVLKLEDALAALPEHLRENK